MAEYIEREALITELNNIAIDYIKDNSIQCSIASGVVINIRDTVILEQPTADVVPVVRCENCVFWDTESKGFSDEHICKMHSIVAVHSRYTNPTDYCSYGERR